MPQQAANCGRANRPITTRFVFMHSTAEKYLKAVLQENDKQIPKIHNLIELMLLCEEMDGSFEMLRADLVTMERYAVRGRYPGEIAEKEDAQSAYAAVATVRKFVRQKLGLK